MSDVFGIGSAVGGVASAFGTYSAAKKNLQATRETNAANLQLAKLQNDWNVDMWNRTNEYNTTSNQLKRWMDAGLNPNSFSGTPYEAAPLESAEMANQQAPDYSMFGTAFGQLGQAIGSAADYALRSRQLDQQDRALDQQDSRLGIDTRLADSQLATAEQIRKNMEEEWKEIGSRTSLNKAKEDVERASLGRIASEIDLNIAQWQNIKESIKYQQLQNYFHSKTMSTRIKQLSADLARTYSDIKWNQQQIAESVQRVCLMAYDKQLKSQQIDIGGLQIGMYRTARDQIKFNFELDKKYREMERANAIFVERCKAFSAVLGGVSSLSQFLPWGRSSSLSDAMFGSSVMQPSVSSWSNPTFP